MRTGNKVKAKALGSIIGRLEAWQNRYPHADREKQSDHAKSILIDLLRELESADMVPTSPNAESEYA